MDTFIFLGVVALGIIIVVPLLILGKVSSIVRRLDRIESQLSGQSVSVSRQQEDARKPTDVRKPTDAQKQETARNSEAGRKQADDRADAYTPTYFPVTEAVPTRPPVTSPQASSPESQPGPVSQPQFATTEKPPVVSKLAVGATVDEPILKTTATPDVTLEKTPPPASRIETLVPGPPKNAGEPRRSALQALFTENWLSKVGIITLVLGVAFFVKYAIDQDWINEIGRVGIGILAGAVILGVGHRLRKDYHLLSSLMVGGGIAVFYITISIAFREYELFSSAATFAILVAITVFAVCFALLYDRQELALFALLGGYASPLLASSGTGNYVVLFTFLLILNTGMLAVAMRKRWNIIGIVSYICTLGFLWGWLFTGFKEQYAGATFFAALFFIQFYLLVLFEYFRTRRITVFQVAVILSNNLSLLLACTFIFKNYPLHIMGLITILIGGANAVVMTVLMHVREIDRRMLYLIIAVVLSFVSLAVPVQLKGHVITMFWAAEAVILLMLWQRSRIRVFHGSFLIMCVLVLISYFMDAAKNYMYDYNETGIHSLLPVVFNRIFITGLVVITSLALCRWLTGRDTEPAAGIWPARRVTPVLTFALIAMTFLVPAFEINYQLGAAATPLWDFQSSALMIWAVTYAAAIAAIFRRQVARTQWVYMLLFVVALLFVCAGLPAITDFRWNVYFSDNVQHAGSVFLLHYLMWPGVACLFYTLVRNLNVLPRQTTLFAWVLTAAGVVVLSIEADNTTIQLAGNQENYYALLYDVHTFGYPILWGLVAAGLMLWGVRRREVLPRQIALVFFGLIILKFYVSDVWRMSQAGRIISFVALGVILLVVSFLQQRIKTLVRDDEKPENETLGNEKPGDDDSPSDSKIFESNETPEIK